MRVRVRDRVGFTLIELLVVIAIIALLISILLPAFSAARNTAKFVRSQANTHSIGQLGQVRAGSEHLPPRRIITFLGKKIQIATLPKGVVHPQSDGGIERWVGLGAWDWGGGPGTQPNFAPGGDFSPERRPLTRENSGVGLASSENMDTRIFEAPNDEGHEINPNYTGSWPDDLISMRLSRGTSYQGEFVWFRATPPLEGALRYGSFMRPTSLMPDASETTVFTEARFGQAYISAEEFVEGGTLGDVPFDVTGWYGKIGEFAVSFGDGHAAKIKIRKKGTMYHVNEFDILRYPNRRVMARGPGWRVDCFPAPFVAEHFVGNP